MSTDDLARERHEEKTAPTYAVCELLSIARRQHEMGLHDIEVLDWKTYITLAAQLGVLGVAQALAWPGARGWFLLAVLGVGIVNLAVTGWSLRAQQYHLEPNVKKFWEKHGAKPDSEAALHLLSNIEDGIEENLAAARVKGRSINRGLVALFLSVLMTGIEWFLEWGMKQ